MKAEKKHCNVKNEDKKPRERPRRRLRIKTRPIKMWVCGLNSNYIRIRSHSGLFERGIGLRKHQTSKHAVSKFLRFEVATSLFTEIQRLV